MKVFYKRYCITKPMHFHCYVPINNYVVGYGKGQACSLGKTIKGDKEIEFRKPCFNTQKCTQQLLLFDCAVLPFL